MWGHHGHHRKGRLSLPSIRISTAPDLSKSTESNSAPLDRAHGGLSSSQPSATAAGAGAAGGRPIVHDFQNYSGVSASGQTSAARLSHHHHHHHHHHHAAPTSSRTSTSHNASISSSSARDRDSVRSRNDAQAQQQDLMPAFKENPYPPLTESQRELDQSLLFRSLRGEYRPSIDDEQHLQHDQLTAANDPFMPPELIAAIQTSMKDCAEYERQCAQLEHSIEHKILMFSHILEAYEGQDHTATELREMISASQTLLQSANPTLQSAESTAKTAKEKIDGFERTLEKARDIAEKSKGTMDALEVHMKEQEVIQSKIERWQNALLGTATGLVVLIAIVLAWVFS